MDASDLKQIERELALSLPSEYRYLALNPPFTEPLNDWMYWFFTDPKLVIQETIRPLDGNCEPTVVPSMHFVFGQTAFGDLYVMNSFDNDSSVYCLSHETHELTKEFNTLEQYVEEWRNSNKTDVIEQSQSLFRRIVSWARRNI